MNYQDGVNKVKELLGEWDKIEKRLGQRQEYLRNHPAEGDSWKDESSRDLQKRARAIQKEAKLTIAGLCIDWAKKNGVEAHARVEMDFRSYYGLAIELGMLSLWNSKGALKPTTWMNKVSVMARNGYIVTHKIRSDSTMLSPFAENFSDFAEQLYKDLGAKSY